MRLRTTTTVPTSSVIVKRSVIVGGHKTSVSLEDAFWNGLKHIASARGLALSEIVAAIDSQRHHGNLSSAIRLFVLDHYRSLVDVADGGASGRDAGRRLVSAGATEG